MQAQELALQAGVDGLAKTAKSLEINQAAYAKDGKALLIHIGGDNASDKLVVQRIGQILDRGLSGLVVNLRVDSKDVGGIVEEAGRIIRDGNIRSVVVINEDETPVTTAICGQLQGLHKNSRIIDVQSKDAAGPIFVPIPAIYDLALRLGFGQDINAAFLDSIGIIQDTDKNPIDPNNIFNYYSIRLIPKARPAEVNADAEAQRITKEAIESSL